jgi:hypothetical protein
MSQPMLFGKTTEVSQQTDGTELLEIINNIPGNRMDESDADHGFQILMDQKIIESIQEEDNSKGEENNELTPSHKMKR